MDAATVIERLGLQPHPDGGPVVAARLGLDLAAGEEPHDGFRRGGGRRHRPSPIGRS